MEMGVPLRPNLLSGVLNQCAKAGLMDDCMRVVIEMKGEFAHPSPLPVRPYGMPCPDDAM